MSVNSILKTYAIRTVTAGDLLVFISIVMIASLANVLLKLGASKFVPFVDLLQFVNDNLIILVAYLVYLLPIILTVIAYRKYSVVAVQSIVALVYIFTPIFAFLAGTESFDMLKLVGVLVITFAVIYIVNLNRKEA